MLLFDIGANRGDAVIAGLGKGFTKIIAVEAASRVFAQLVANFIYEEKVTPLKFAVSDSDNKTIKFFECAEDGLSTLNIDWLTKDGMPYKGKPYRECEVSTIKLDTLCEVYGKPDLIKIDVEGAEWDVLHGLTENHGILAFEWTDVTIGEHCAQLEYLESIGYSEVAPQFIVNHLDEPTEWFSIKGFHIDDWVIDHKDAWTDGGWKVANLRPTADVGMIWVR
jgi:FkbM family methyltransferase